MVIIRLRTRAERPRCSNGARSTTFVDRSNSDGTTRGGDLHRERQTTSAVRVGPRSRDQAAAPMQHRTWRDQPVALHRGRQQPDQLRASIARSAPVQPRPRTGSAQNRDLTSQYQQLDILGHAGAGEQHQPADQPDEDQIEQPQRHGAQSSCSRTTRVRPGHSTHSDFWHPTRVPAGLNSATAHGPGCVAIW